MTFPRFSAAHYLAIGLMLASLGSIGSELADWNAALTPKFVFSAAGIIGAQLVAMFSKQPDTGRRNRRTEDRAAEHPARDYEAP